MVAAPGDVRAMQVSRVLAFTLDPVCFARAPGEYSRGLTPTASVRVAAGPGSHFRSGRSISSRLAGGVRRADPAAAICTVGNVQLVPVEGAAAGAQLEGLQSCQIITPVPVAAVLAPALVPASPGRVRGASRGC